MPGGSTEGPRPGDEDGAAESMDGGAVESEGAAPEPSPEEIAPAEIASAESAPSEAAPRVAASTPRPALSRFSPADFFLQSGWQQDTEHVDAATRRQVIDQTAVSQQSRAGAETLWAAAHPADALVLAQKAYRTAKVAYDLLPPDVVARSHRLASASAREAAVLEVARKNDGLELPVLDASVKPIDEECYQAWLDAQGILLTRCHYFSATPQKIRVTQTTRIGTVVTLALIALISFWWSNRQIREVSASAHWNDLPRFAPENAFDGDPETEWLLPDSQRGWVELRLRPVRTLSRIRVTNGHNGPYADRGTRDFRIELYRGGEHLRDLTGRFESVDSTAAATTFELDGEQIDRLRFVVVSHHNLGGALTDLTIE